MKLTGINADGKLQDIKVAQDGSIMNVVGSLYGAEYITDTALHTTSDVFIALQFIEDSIIDQYNTEVGAAITGNTLIGQSISSGNILYGRFKSIKLSNGKVFAYKGV